MSCVGFELLSRVPITGLRLRLCRAHVDRCGRCRGESERGDGLPSILMTADRLPAGLDLRPGVTAAIAGLRPLPAAPGAWPPPARRPRRWAYAAAATVLLAAALLWFIAFDRRSAPRHGSAEDRAEARTRLCSAKIEDRPARVFQVQSRHPDRTIYWIARGDSRS